MNRYIAKATGHKLVRWHSVPIFCSTSNTEFGDLYWDITAQQCIVIADGVKYNYLEIDENPCEIDCHAIAKELTDLLEDLLRE